MKTYEDVGGPIQCVTKELFMVIIYNVTLLTPSCNFTEKARGLTLNPNVLDLNTNRMHNVTELEHMDAL